MKRGKYCPVCTNIWDSDRREAQGLPELETCPECPQVVLLAVTDWDENRKWLK